MLIWVLIAAQLSGAQLSGAGELQQAQGLHGAGDLRGAEAAYKKVIGVCEGSPCLPAALNSLASLYLEHDQLEGARRTLARLERVDMQEAERARFLGNQGALAYLEGRLDAAEKHYGAAWRLWIEQGLAEAPEVGGLLNHLGLLCLVQEKNAAAALWLERAERLEAQQGRGESFAMMAILANRVFAELQLGHLEVARMKMDRAKAIACEVLSEGHPARVWLIQREALYLRRAGQRGAARNLDKQAETLLRSYGVSQRLGDAVDIRQLQRAKRGN